MEKNLIDSLICGDALAVLQTLPENSVDAVITDPPYGLGEVKDIAGLLTAWIHNEDDSSYIGKAGFMGKEWDAGVPGPRYWREVYRVMKPGAYLLAFGGTRSYGLLEIAVRLAGFECRDMCIWLHGQGFPKSLDVSKAVDHMKGARREVRGYRDGRGVYDAYDRARRDKYTGNVYGLPGCSAMTPITIPATVEAQQWQGWGTALKPAQEPIILARKPLSEPTIAANVLKWGTGGLNIDASRIAHKTIEGGTLAQNTHLRVSVNAYETSAFNGKGNIYTPPSQGRWPANLLLSHAPDCQQVGVKRVKGDGHKTTEPVHHNQRASYGAHLNETVDYRYNDLDGMETVEDWLCSDDCPIRELDRQSGIRKSGGGVKSKAGSSIGFLRGEDNWRFQHDGEPCEPSEGGASRYFQQFSPDPDDFIPFLYTSKASRTERNAGCEGLPEVKRQTQGRDEVHWIDRQDGKGRVPVNVRIQPAANYHPTVKPLALCKWLVKLICREDGIMLDPFCGSGSILMAAVYEGCHFIGIDQSEGYCAIARSRVQYAQQQVISDNSGNGNGHRVAAPIPAIRKGKQEEQASLWTMEEVI